MTAPSPLACVSCGSPTGTVTGAEGSREWVTSYLVLLGLAQERAEALVTAQGDGLAVRIPICPQCALCSGVRTALDLPGFDVPTTCQLESGRP